MPMGNSVEEKLNFFHCHMKTKSQRNVETDELINVFIGRGYDMIQDMLQVHVRTRSPLWAIDMRASRAGGDDFLWRPIDLITL